MKQRKQPSSTQKKEKPSSDERRHHVRMHKLAASTTKTPHKTIHGGNQRKKRWVHQKWAKSTQRTKQRRQRHWVEKSQIWQALCATW